MKQNNNKVNYAINTKNMQLLISAEYAERIKQTGGTLPENIPTPEKSISEIEREQLKKLKADKKKMLDE